MWEPLDRARRRLLGDGPAEASPAPAVPGTVASRDAATDLTFALGRPDLERLIGALAEHAGDETRPDTPARLQAALARAIGAVSGSGRPTVTRRPAGLYTPETWQIDIADADARTRSTVEQAIRGGGLV